MPNAVQVEGTGARSAGSSLTPSMNLTWARLMTLVRTCSSICGIVGSSAARFSLLTRYPASRWTERKVVPGPATPAGSSMPKAPRPPPPAEVDLSLPRPLRESASRTGLGRRQVEAFISPVPVRRLREADGGAGMGNLRPKRVSRRGGARSGPPSREPAAGSAAPDVPLVELEVPGGPEEHWLRDVASRWDVRTRFRLCRPTGPSPGRLLQVVELAGTPGDLGEIERHLRRRRDLSALTILALSPSRRFVRAVGPMPAACGRIFESGAICASCRFVATDGGASGDRWTLIVPRSSRTIRTVARIGSRDRHAEPRILRMRRYVPPRTLTPRQAAALETAFRLGFYSFPRRTNLKEIARILHVSRATASEHLRRAEAKMLAPELPAS